MYSISIHNKFQLLSIITMFATILLVLVALSSVSAFAPTRGSRFATTALSMKSDFQKAVSASIVGASLFLGQVAHAEIDYEGIKYLGGGDKVSYLVYNLKNLPIINHEL